MKLYEQRAQLEMIGYNGNRRDTWCLTLSLMEHQSNVAAGSKKGSRREISARETPSAHQSCKSCQRGQLSPVFLEARSSKSRCGLRTAHFHLVVRIRDRLVDCAESHPPKWMKRPLRHRQEGQCLKIATQVKVALRQEGHMPLFPRAPRFRNAPPGGGQPGHFATV